MRRPSLTHFGHASGIPSSATAVVVALAFGLLGLGINAPSTHAATIQWVSNANINWGTANSWSPGSLILNNDFVGNDILLAHSGMNTDTNLNSGMNLVTNFIVYNVSGSRAVQNGLTDDTSSTITLQGDGANPLLSMGNAATATWALRGLSSAGTNRQLNLVLDIADSTQGTFHVENSGATLNLSTNISTTNSGVGITKTGAGTVILSGNNSYAGPTLVNAGTLSIQSNSALGTTAGGTTVAVGATLQLQGGITITGESVLFTGNGATGTVGAIRNVSGDNVWTGNMTTGVSGNHRIASDSGSLTISGDINLVGGITYLQGHGDGEISGNISGSGDLGRSGIGSGDWILSGMNTYTGQTRVISNTLTVQGGFAIPDVSPVLFQTAAGAILRLDSSETVGSIHSDTTPGIVDLTSNTLTTGGNNSSTTFSGAINGSGGLTKIGTGNQTLGGENTYTGQTIVQGGTLTLGESGSISDSSAITVGSGATFNVGAVSGGWTLGASQSMSGTGTVVGNATIAGNLNPGNSPGVLSFSEDLLMTGTTATTMEILGLVRGDDYDGIDVGGTLGYDGTLTLDLGTTFGAGSYDFQLFNFTDTTGSFGGVDITGDYTASMSDNSGVWTASTNAGNETWTFTQSTGLLNVVVVPEPGSAVLALVGGLGGLALGRSRRRWLESA